MEKVEVLYTGGIGFQVKARQHSIIIDLIKEKGGQDSGMNPPEVFMASLGSCIGVYLVRYCLAAKLDPKDLSIQLDWKLSDDKTKISEINVSVSLPNAEVGRREKALLEVARHCLIHNTILGCPDIHISLSKPKPSLDGF